ncbi:MAG: tRNA lysidine(34) synthetase TilS [Clostridiales Family XIII bacterium]|nr:tRNA lysidine(34) synthetase TilS [Clostridiales Family XIII bacterium]
MREKIAIEHLIPRGGHVVVGFSGGPDSTCLFDVLAELRDELGYTMSAVHINHSLRNIESAEDQRYVETLCEEFGVPLIVKIYDVAIVASHRGKSVEEAGRELRYAAFREAADKVAAERGVDPSIVRIALAHNKGDLSETVLMRIIRGTGPDGLVGVSADRDGDGGYRIVRPLLDISRADIEEYCYGRGFEPRVDSTNAETDYLRNSVRLELLPILRERYNPSVDDALARLSRAAAESRDYFDLIVNAAIETECEFAGAGDAEKSGKPADVGDAGRIDEPADASDAGKNDESADASDAEGDGFAYAEFPLESLRGLHPAIRHRLVVAVFGMLGLKQDIGFSHIIAADELIERGRTGKRTDFPGGYRFGVSYEKAVFIAPGRGDMPYEARSFKVAVADIGKTGEKTTLFQDSPLPIEAEVMDYDGELKSGRSLVLDYDALSSAATILRIRAKERGDRMFLPGVKGSKKLQDIFVDAKISREKRLTLPVLATEDEVLWIPGIRHTRLYAPEPGTKRVVILTPLI